MSTAATPSSEEDAPTPILTTEFARLAASMLAFAVAMGATFPVLPRFADDELGAGDTMVGLVLGSMAVGAVIARPILGYLGDSRGRRVLVVGGSVLSAVTMAAHIAVGSLPVLVALRLLFGMGQGAMLVGSTTLAVDMAPDDRSGEATSYIFVALHTGSGLGALLGEWLLRSEGFDAVWLVAATGMALSAVGGMTLRPAGPTDSVSSGGLLLYRSAVLPGAILGLGTLGFIGFNAFVPLFADEIGVDNAAPFFFAASVTIVAIRGFGAKLPDRLGPVRGGTLALTGSGAGLLVIGLSSSAVGLGVGSVVLAAGTAMLLPSLVPAVIAGVPATERSRALSTYTLFLEISAAFGALLFGGIASISSYGAAYVVAAAVSAVALTLLRLTLGRSDSAT